jgi:hypothetical protein
MIHQSITKSTKKYSFSEVQTDEKENLRTIYNAEKMESLKAFIQSSGEIGLVKCIEKVYKDNSKEVVLADGYRRRRVVKELGLNYELYDFAVYTIREAAFESKEAFEMEYQKLFVYLGAATQESEPWTQVDYGKAILRLEMQLTGIKQKEIGTLLNKSESYISTARKYALICQNERIYDAFSKEIISIAMFKKAYLTNSHDIEETQNYLLSFLDNSESELSNDISEIEETELQGFEDFDDEDSDDDFDSDSAYNQERKEQIGIQIEDSSFDLRKFKLFVFDLDLLSLSQQKALINVVDSFVNGNEINQQVISYELSQLKLNAIKSEPIEIFDNEEGSDLDF